MNLHRILCLSILILVSNEATAQPVVDSAKAEKNNNQGHWVDLFNGTNLTGWTQKNGTATYKVVDGTIMGTTTQGSPNSFLCTDKDYGDFELTFDVKVDDALNSGVQIRSKTKDPGPGEKFGRVYGPQVEIEASGENGAESGYIYGEATGRDWLTPKDRLIPKKVFNDGQWNSYRVLAQGPRIQTWINEHPVEDLTDEPIFKTHPSGFIGLQVHAIGKDQGPFHVQWRNIRIRETKSDAAAGEKKTSDDGR
jgi:hypothetical protein